MKLDPGAIEAMASMCKARPGSRSQSEPISTKSKRTVLFLEVVCKIIINVMCQGDSLFYFVILMLKKKKTR